MPRPTNTSQRIWSLIDKKGPDECWPWMGWRNEQGYGRFELNGRSYYAHRAIHHIEHPLETRLDAPRDKNAFGFVRHTCDNPCCCNPSHLVLGTHAENMQDKVDRGRQQHYASVESPRAKLTSEEVFWMRLQKKYGATKKALALLYEVSESTVGGACYGRNYRDI